MAVVNHSNRNTTWKPSYPDGMYPKNAAKDAGMRAPETSRRGVRALKQGFKKLHTRKVRARGKRITDEA
jgi:hypothetical protein